jgi:hypothetical protein
MKIRNNIFLFCGLKYMSFRELMCVLIEGIVSFLEIWNSDELGETSSSINMMVYASCIKIKPPLLLNMYCDSNRDALEMKQGETCRFPQSLPLLLQNKFFLCPQSFGNLLNMTQCFVVYGSFLAQLYAYCWFGSELTRLVKNWYLSLISLIKIPINRLEFGQKCGLF